MITGINHINLSVTNIERAFDFYVNTLGLMPLCKWPQGAYLLAGKDWICLNLNLGSAEGRKNDYTHYAFSIAQENFLVFKETLKKAGVKSFKENCSEGDSFYFTDPDGHKLEIHVGDHITRLKEKIKHPWPDTEFFDSKWSKN